MATPPAGSGGSELADAVRMALATGGDAEKATQQQAYMKSAMPYRGFAAPELKALLRPYLSPYLPESREAWETTVLDLWDHATHREEWYAALAVARHRRAKQWLDPESLELWRHLVVTGAWWDVVDETATHLVGDVLAAYPLDVTPLMDQWADDADLWVRRTAVICQVGHRERTDRNLLLRVVEANVDDPSFWLRKAIGWALRDYARTDPDWVWAQVDRLGERLSGLSRREAQKHRV